jgi:hypothetical protein
VRHATVPEVSVLERLTDLPDGVIGFAGHGKLHASDYTDVLLPAVQEVLDAGDDLRVVLVFEDWDGISGGALWQDAKMGGESLTRWKRIALVTDLEWMTHVSHMFGWMTPGELKTFALAERADAIAWAAASD